MQTETYANFLVLVKALAGVDNFTTDEESSILAFANRRIYQAYRESPLWPRYFVESHGHLLMTLLLLPMMRLREYGQVAQQHAQELLLLLSALLLLILFRV